MGTVKSGVVSLGTVGLLLASACGSLVGADLDGWSVGRGATSGGDGGASIDESVPEPVAPNADGSCPADRKACNGHCVSLLDPKYGCAAETCAPCSIPRATTTCNAGVCVVRACEADRGDCNGTPDDGCETDLASDHGHCGVCETACSADSVCNKAACSTSCDEGTTNCDGSCVDLGSNVEHCGSCTKACPAVTNGASTCQQSACSITCNPGFVVDGTSCKTPPRLLLVGGQGETKQLFDVWEWNGTSWTMLYPSTGAVRGPLALLDGKVVVSNRGDDGLTTLHDWSGFGWNPHSTTGAPPWPNGMVVNNNGTLVMYGGQTIADFSTETWTLTGTAWTKRNITGPSARSESAMTAVNGKVVLFGGIDRSDPNATLLEMIGDTWEFDGTNWTKRNVTGPDRRYNHSMARLGNKAVLFGGRVYGPVDGPNQTETWEWDGSTWTNRNIPGPPQREGAAMASFAGKVVLYGGYSEDAHAMSDFWAYDGNAWTQITTSGPSPGARSGHHAMVEIP